jgi:hypothetical protein
MGILYKKEKRVKKVEKKEKGSSIKEDVKRKNTSP